MEDKTPISAELEKDATNLSEAMDFSFLDETQEVEPTKEIEADSSEEYLEVDYLKEKKKIPKSEWKTNIQKGLDYDFKVEKLKEEARLRADAESRANDREAELSRLKLEMANKDIETKRQQIKAKLESDGYDIKEIDEYINSSPVMADLQQTAQQVKAQLDSLKAQEVAIKAKERIAQEKLELTTKPYYSILSERVDSILASAPQLQSSVAYRLALGEAIESGKIDLKSTQISNKDRSVKAITSDGNAKPQKETSSFGSALDKAFAPFLRKAK